MPSGLAVVYFRCKLSEVFKFSIVFVHFFTLNINTDFSPPKLGPGGGRRKPPPSKYALVVSKW